MNEGSLSLALLVAERGVLVLLVVLSVVCVAIAVERAWVFLSDRSDRERLAESVNAFLRGGEPAALQGVLGELGGAEARILGAGLELADKGPGAAEKAMIATATAERIRMERGLSVLATTGSNAPFIGLFGTVLGILQGLGELAAADGQANPEVLASISSALIATAVGLAVAIPAVVLYNLLQRWVKVRLGRTDSLADLVIARLRGDAAGA